MNNILVIIAARGGSKGIKGKNIRPLLGQPLISYSIRQALRWGKAKRVIVSTDSEQIAQVATDNGAEVPFIRPAVLSSDTAAKGAVIQHALKECERKYNEQYDIIVDLDATSPVRTVRDLDLCLEQFNQSTAQTLFSVVSAHKNPYFNMVERDDQGKVTLCKKRPDSVVRRQDAPDVYSLNASIYFYKRDYVLGTDKLTPIYEGAEMYVMDDMSGIDIDREVDFKFIEFLVSEGLVTL